MTKRTRNKFLSSLNEEQAETLGVHIAYEVYSGTFGGWLPLPGILSTMAIRRAIRKFRRCLELEKKLTTEIKKLLKPDL
jgi:hypothetical protein